LSVGRPILRVIPIIGRKAKSVPGNQDADDLVRIKGESLANHTVLVAQSGSGKSFFLGRILEEIVIKTRARVVILDPNGDFRRFSEVVKDEEWKTYATKKPKYPHEPSKSDFEPKWKAMEIVVYGGPQNRPKESQFLKIGWDTFPISFLSEELEPIGQSQVYHCHEFVKAIMLLEALTNWDLSGSTKKTSTTSALLHARTLLKRSRAEGIRTVLDDVFPIVEEHDQGNQRPEKWFLPSLPFVLTLGTDWRKLSADDARARAIAAAEFVTPEVERFYFGRANEYVAAKLVSDSLFHRPAIDAKKVRRYRFAVFSRFSSGTGCVEQYRRDILESGPTKLGESI
jgi:hypothetical protein